MYYNNRIGKDSRLLNRVIGQSIDGQVAFKDLRKFHYNILCRSEMKESGAEILSGRAKSVHLFGFNQVLNGLFTA
jgi:intergrase/recombinase